MSKHYELIAERTRLLPDGTTVTDTLERKQSSRFCKPRWEYTRGDRPGCEVFELMWEAWDAWRKTERQAA